MKKNLVCFISVVLLASLLMVGCKNTAKANTVTNTGNVDSSNISYYFSNEGEKPDKQLINLINSSTKTLDVAIYSLTKKDIVEAIISAEKRNVAVRLMSDKTEAATKSQQEELQLIKNSGIPIKINSHSGLLHDKFTVVDGSIIATGSFNYSQSANSVNDENLIIIKDSNIAQGYDKNFNDMWNDKSRFTDY
ncbi:phospholipase D-like domain-containing protein [uncultured Clostridium sp.]|uniref:phospholipase D-like domain-containing protein n=1 Tax=uncultured Clostridium sp. TaxID=59620 RepID=UPI0028EFDD7A|nr:phospholipase D-like domain-containing protein [uncultured Clostridium sp.]